MAVYKPTTLQKGDQLPPEVQALVKKSARKKSTSSRQSRSCLIDYYPKSCPSIAQLLCPPKRLRYSLATPIQNVSVKQNQLVQEKGLHQ